MNLKSGKNFLQKTVAKNKTVIAYLKTDYQVKIETFLIKVY